MKVIAISNQKGGVAKTTTTIALAAALADLGDRVLAVDLDPQANLTLGLGVDPESVPRTSYHLMTNGVGISDVVQPCSAAGVGVVPSHVTLAAAERTLYGEIGFDEILKGKIEAARAAYDRILIDCPPSLGLLTVNAITAADLVLVPVQCEYFAAKGLEQLLEIASLVRRRRNPTLVVRILPTLFDGRNGICRRVLDELRSAFPAETCRSVIGIDTQVREAAARGIPITRFAPKARAAAAYRSLATEVRGA